MSVPNPSTDRAGRRPGASRSVNACTSSSTRNGSTVCTPNETWPSWKAASGRTPMDDPYRLQRFTQAQDAGGMYQQAVAELRAGWKVSHWIWFVFPQVASLGFSSMSQRYAISGLAEAQAYLNHPVLGPRLTECASIVAGTEGKTADEIFGPVDAMKLRSSMTLFAAAAPEDPVFAAVLAKHFGGVPDDATLARL